MLQRSLQATILVCTPYICLAGNVHTTLFARLRAYIGFLPVRRTIPNPTHYALAALQHAGAVGPLITQNVDGLHHGALRRVLPEPEVDRRILELHGSIFVSSPAVSYFSPGPRGGRGGKQVGEEIV